MHDCFNLVYASQLESRASEQKLHLVTHSDFDGLVCAVLFKDLGMIDDILFVYPKDMQDGIIDIAPNDITTNLPYVASCHLNLNHHACEIIRRGDNNLDNHIIDTEALSVASVVYDYYGANSLP